MNYKVFCATVKKGLQIRIRAYPVSFMVGCILTSFYTILGSYLMYHYFFQGQLSELFVSNVRTTDYMSYAIVGSLMYQFIVRTCLNVSRTLITELREGTLESLMLAPFRRTSYFLGNMTMQTVLTLGETAIAAVIGIAFGFKISDFSIFQFIIAVLLSLYGFFGLSLMLGCVMLYTRDTYISQNTLFAIIFLVCGITFPKEALPYCLQLFGNVIPVTDAVTLMRASLLGGLSNSEFLCVSIKEVILGTVYIVAGMPLMKHVEHIALEQMEG